MGNLVKKLLQLIGLYKPLLNYKRKLNQQEAEKLEKTYHSKRLLFYKEFLKPGELIFDVGANVGNRVKVFIELQNKVVAIEPQQECINILKKKFGSEIDIEQVGLGKEVGEMEMFIADESTISTFSREFIDKTKDNKFKRNNWDQKIIVPITTLDHLISKYGVPHFCKIDVEGFESEVLKGLSKPISSISFEYNVPEMFENVLNCLSHLYKLSPEYKFNYCIGESMTFVFPQHNSYKQFFSHVNTDEFQKTDFGDVYAFKKGKDLSD